MIEVLTGIPDVSVTVDRLPVGDYQIDGRLLFERKRLVDFAESIIGGRLFRQAWRLANARQRSAIIMEGRSPELKRSNMRREAIQGALITLSLGFGIPVLRSSSPEESARLMIYAVRQVWSEHLKAVHRFGRRPVSRLKRKLYMLQGLPGIGPAKALRLLDRFGSVRAVCNAAPDELESVYGVGVHTAKAIVDTVQAEQIT